MKISGKIICSLVSAAVAGMFLSCNNNMETETSKSDTMNTTIADKMILPDRNIKTPAGTIHVNDGGSGNGLPVLFIHSFGGSSMHWENQLTHLRTNRRAIAIDLRGHGISDTPADNDYSVESMANDIAAVVDSLQLKRFVLVGHSMGGSSAIAYAARYPQRVAGLLLTGTPGKTPASLATPIIASLESDKYEQVMEDYMKKLLTNAQPATVKIEREGMNKLSKEASIAFIKAAFDYDPLPDLRNYPGPKMILSPAVEEQPNSLHASFPAIPYKVVPGTSHWIQLDKPEAFNRILDDFLAEVEKQK
jgi:pimeloyl-ACP methyl ester carboxylesterase